MDFLDNVVKSSNAILKDRLNNPFGAASKQQAQTATAAGNKAEPSQPADPNQATTAESAASRTSGSPAASNQQQDSSQQPSQNQRQSLTGGQDDANGSDINAQFAAIAADAEAVTQKAVKGAKNIGNFLFSMANKAGQTVSQTAKQVKQVVESTNILTDFTREQQDFIREHGGSMQAAELPWANISDSAKAADIREQILSLSQDKRNFVRGPPNGANYKFESNQCYPIALSLLREDPNLNKLRYELVPKLVNEDTFWTNYFYRVSLLKQMIDKGENVSKQGWASSRSSSGEGPDELTATEEVAQSEETGTDKRSSSTKPGTIDRQETTASSILQEVGSFDVESQDYDTIESKKLFAEADDLKSRLRELNIGSLDEGGGQDDTDKWEEELQRDLQEFELVSGVDVSALDDEALYEDIMDMKKSADA